MILMMDDDVLVPPGFASKMLRCLDRGAVVACRMTSPDGSPQNGLAKLKPGEVVECTPPGTCFVYDRTKVPAEFDEGYEGSQWEDTDFMVQVQQLGLKTVATGDVHIIHDNPFFRQEMTEEKKEVWNRNRARFVSKWPKVAAEMGIS